MMAVVLWQPIHFLPIIYPRNKDRRLSKLTFFCSPAYSSETNCFSFQKTFYHKLLNIYTKTFCESARTTLQGQVLFKMNTNKSANGIRLNAWNVKKLAGYVATELLSQRPMKCQIELITCFSGYCSTHYMLNLINLHYLHIACRPFSLPQYLQFFWLEIPLIGMVLLVFTMPAQFITSKDKHPQRRNRY